MPLHALCALLLIAPADVPLLELPQLDGSALFAEDEARNSPGPLRVAAAVEVLLTPDNSGVWETLADGSLAWRLRIASPGATDLALGFRHFLPPGGAELRVFTEEGRHVIGPFSRDDAREGELWTPALPGDRILIELKVPASTRDALDVEISRVSHGYRDMLRTGGIPKSGSCNNDILCPVGSAWQDEARAVARFSMTTPTGTGVCSGTLVMDTSADFIPYFLSANHCQVDASNDQSVVVYWNYQASTCGGARDGSLAQSQQGAVFRASHPSSDFLLLELSQAPAASVNPYYAGWDRSGLAALGSVVIHHPSGDEKAISFDSDSFTSGNNCIESFYFGTHWLVGDYEDGTTEPGSSGAALFEALRRQIVGTLSGGDASCTNPSAGDCYGKFSTSWNAGSSASSRLRDWLDTAGTNATNVVGRYPPPRVDLVLVGGTDVCATVGAGNGDGRWDPGENVIVPITLRASSTLTGVNGTLTCSTPGVTILDGNANWPTLVAGAATSSSAPHFQAAIARGVSCGTSLDFHLALTASGGFATGIDFTHVTGEAPLPAVPVAIPDGGTLTSHLVVSTGSAVSDVNVSVSIAHGWVGDLKLTLRSPQGTTITLLDRPGVSGSGFGCGDDDMAVVFDDEAATSASQLENRCAGATPWFSGNARPVTALAGLDGQSPLGTWTLSVIDIATPDAGSLVDWRLVATPAIPATCTACLPPCVGTADFDGDGVKDLCDACVLYADPDQADSDGDGLGNACEFEWGDLAPLPVTDGQVTVSDIVRLLRLIVGLEAATTDQFHRGNVAPASLVAGSPQIATPTLAAPQGLDVSDAVLLLRVAVDLTRFTEPY